MGRWLLSQAVFALMFLGGLTLCLLQGAPLHAQEARASSAQKAQALSAQRAQAPLAPKAVRVAYIEGGFYPEFVDIFAALAQALEDMGLVYRGNVPVSGVETSIEDIWQWLAAHAGGKRITFVPDACYSAAWDEDLFEEKKNALLQRIAAKEIDLVLAFGMMAAQSLVTADIEIPILVLGSTDPVAAGMIRSAEDSGKNNVFALVRENRYYRELMLFHSIFKFKKLGVAYEDNDVGRGEIAYSQIEQAAQDGNFEIVACKRPYANILAEDVATMIYCHEDFVRRGADAVYMTISYGEGGEHMGDILRPLIQAGLPTFSQLGLKDVQKGALMSVSEESFKGEGAFVAKALANILAGQLPRAQKQRYDATLSLAVNFRTAMLIGWFPPLSVLAAVDTIVER